MLNWLQRVVTGEDDWQGADESMKLGSNDRVVARAERADDVDSSSAMISRHVRRRRPSMLTAARHRQQPLAVAQEEMGQQSKTIVPLSCFLVKNSLKFNKKQERTNRQSSRILKMTKNQAKCDQFKRPARSVLLKSSKVLALDYAVEQYQVRATRLSTANSNVIDELVHTTQKCSSFALFLLVCVSFCLSSTSDIKCYALSTPPSIDITAQPSLLKTLTPPPKITSKATNQTLDFNALASEFQQDNSKTDTLIKVINDTNGVDANTRQRLYNLISEYKSTTEIDSVSRNNGNRSNTNVTLMMKPSSGQVGPLLVKSRGKHRQIVYEDTIFTKRALREFEANMNISYEGESKSDPAIHWVILYNDTTILVVRSANKYYYWTYGQSVGSLIIFCMIVVGNLSILHRLKSCRRRRSNVNYFIVQLAIADLLVGIFSVTLDSWLRIQKAFLWGLFACRTSKYISALFIYSSTNLLVALSVDRWEAVVKPLAFTKNRSRGYHLVAASWILAIISALPVTFFTKIKEIDGLPQCWIDLNSYGWRLYMIYLTSLLLIVPTLIIAVCYIHIVYTIWSKGRLVADQKHKRERTSHQNYCASPESLGQDFSSSSRLNGRSSNFIEDSSCLERESSRRISWGRRCKRSTARLKSGNVFASKSITSSLGSGSRRASSESSTGQDWRGRFKRSRTIEIGPENKQQRKDPAKAQTNQTDTRTAAIPKSLTCAIAIIDNTKDLPISDFNNNSGRNSNLVNICANSFVGSNLDNEDHNQMKQTSHGGIVADDRARNQVEHTRRSQAAGSGTGQTYNEHDKDALKMMDNERNSSLAQVKADPAASQHSGLSRVASQGLRILSFARSSSGLSSGSLSASTTTSSSASSPSTLSSKSRLAISSARSSVATQIMVSAVACQLNNGQPAEVQRAEVRLATGQLLAGQSDADLNDRRQTVTPDVLDRTKHADQTVAVNETETKLGVEKPDNGHDDGIKVDGEIGGWHQADKSGSITTSSTQVRLLFDKPKRSSCRKTDIGRQSGQTKRGSLLSYKNNSTVECKQTSESGDKQGSHLNTFANMITMTKTKKNLGSSNKYITPQTTVDVDMQTDSQTISKSCDKMAKGMGKGKSGFEKQYDGQNYRKQQQQQRAQRSSQSKDRHPSSSCGRDKDYVAQQHGTGVIPKARIKTIKMTLVIVVAYILCWSPFLILNLCGVFGLIKNDTNVSHALLTLSQSLAHLNSAVNPIIFWLFSSRRSQTNTNTATTVAGGLWTTNQPNNHYQHRQPNKIATNGAL